MGTLSSILTLPLNPPFLSTLYSPPPPHARPVMAQIMRAEDNLANVSVAVFLKQCGVLESTFLPPQAAVRRASAILASQRPRKRLQKTKKR